MNQVVRVVNKGSVALIVMEDLANKNMFTDALMSGLTEAFSAVKRQDETRAVVLCGYDNIFSAGGTKDELLRINAGALRFTDISLYDLLLDCAVPVIAAMQGHALGGGLALGSYADVMVLADESIYSANFMNYGFTPGFGSTYIVPQKFGAVLGNEILFSGKNYFGREIKERGVGIRVEKKKDVFNAAWEIAAEIAEKPKLSLTLLKAHLSEKIRAELRPMVERELKMHQATFSQPEVARKINEGF